MKNRMINVVTLVAISMISSTGVCMESFSLPKDMQLMDLISREDTKKVCQFQGDVNFMYQFAGTKQKQSPLSYAVARGSMVMIGILLSKGAELDDMVIREANRLDDESITKTLKSFFGEDFSNAISGNEECSEEEVVIDYEEIFEDLKKGDMSSLEKVIKQKGFDPKAKFTTYKNKDGFGNPLVIYGSTLFIEAAALGNVAAMKLLKEAGADIYASTTNGWTALHAAATHGRLETASYILEITADKPKFVWQKDSLTGATAIQAALYFQKLDVRNLLLNK